MADIKRGNLSQIAADYVRKEITSGRLKQEEKIVESQIARQLGMSRGPVRDALKQLMYEGFVDYESNKGCTVTLLSPKDAYEIFYLRGSLEKLALECCGGTIPVEQLLVMEEALDRMRQARDRESDDLSEMVAYDEIFHRQILIASQMERLIKMWESMNSLNGAMFLTVKNVNQYEAQHGNQDVPEQDLNARNNSSEAHNILYQVLRKGDLENSKQALDRHYLETGRRIYRTGIKMSNSELFF